MVKRLAEWAERMAQPLGDALVTAAVLVIVALVGYSLGYAYALGHP